MKSSFINRLVKAAIPISAVATCCFATVTMNAGLLADVDEPEGEIVPVTQADVTSDEVTSGEGSAEVIEAAAEPDVQDAEIYRGSLEVTRDADGNVPGVTVYDEEPRGRCAFGTAVFEQNGEVIASATSNESGDFSVPDLPAGTYVVRAGSEFGSYQYTVDVLDNQPLSAAEAEEAGDSEPLAVKFVPEAQSTDAEVVEPSPAEPLAAEAQMSEAPIADVLVLQVPSDPAMSQSQNTYPSDVVFQDAPLPPAGGGGGGYYGGGGGYTGGGAGGFGGGGGIGVLLGAGLGAGTYALLDDDDSSTSSISSPAGP